MTRGLIFSFLSKQLQSRGSEVVSSTDFAAYAAIEDTLKNLASTDIVRMYSIASDHAGSQSEIGLASILRYIVEQCWASLSKLAANAWT